MGIKNWKLGIGNWEWDKNTALEKKMRTSELPLVPPASSSPPGRG